MTNNKRTQNGMLAQLPKRITAMRHDVEKATRKMLDRGVEMLPPAPRKQMRELTHRIERAGTDLQRRVERTRHDVEKRGERLVATVTKRAEQVLTPLVRRLDVASRTELDRLRKRVAALEKKRTEHRPAASLTPVA